MEVTGQLEALSVACEGSCGMAEGGALLSSGGLSVAGEMALKGPSVADGTGTEELLEAEGAGPPSPGPAGGALDGPRPGPLELPATGAAASSNGTWPSCSPAAGGEPVAGRGEERSQGPQAPAEGEELPGLQSSQDKAPSAPLDLHFPSSRLALTGDLGQEAANDERISPDLEGQGGRAIQSPCEVFVVEKAQLLDEGGFASAESDSGSESDTDTDSSVSSTSSDSPVLSEEDDQQHKNDDNTHIIGKKGEVSEKKPLPVEDVKIFLSDSAGLMPFGKVSSIIENLVVVESLKGLPPVNEDTVLFKQDCYAIGKVFEVFGPVSHPFYTIQLSSPEHIEAKGIKVHDDVYFAPSAESFTQYIFPEKIKQDKGSDASWKNDEEPPPEALDFSDDEKEKAAKQQKKSQNLQKKKFRSQDESNENGIHYQPRRHYPSDYSSGSLRGEFNPSFSRGKFPHSLAPPHSYRQQVRPLQHYSSDYKEFQKPSTFFPCQQKESPQRHQYSFPPPSFGAVSNEANRFPPPPPTWGWPQDCVQNTHDPLLSLLLLPPPPPPPLPPPP